MSADKIPNDHTSESDTDAIYLRADSDEFLTRYIEPELLRAFGTKTLQNVGEIKIERSMKEIKNGNITTKWHGLSIYRDIKNNIPFTVYIDISEERSLRDEELLVQWPLLEKAELAYVLNDALFTYHNELNDNDLEDYAKGRITKALQAQLMQTEVDVLKEVGEAEGSIAETLFGKEVFVFTKRLLVLKRRSRPRLDFTAGYRYDGDTYILIDSAAEEKDTLFIGKSFQEIQAFMKANRQFHHQVDSQDSQEFIKTLAMLGFRSLNDDK